MISHVLADARDHPVVEPYHAHWRHATDILARALEDAGPEAGDCSDAGIALALSFDTWRALARDRGSLDDRRGRADAQADRA